MKVLAVIVARSGSKRVKDKNMRFLAGNPLIGWAADAINKSKLITDAVISTDSEEYGQYAESHGIRFIKRPDSISGDKADIAEATAHATQGVYDYIVTLQAAVPMRPHGAIDALLEEIQREKSSGGLSMVKRTPWMWNMYGGYPVKWWGEKYPRSQDIDFSVYEEINAIQISDYKSVMEKKRWSYPLSIVELPQWCSVDIDTEEDLIAANEYVYSILPLYNREREYRTFTVNRDGK